MASTLKTCSAWDGLCRLRWWMTSPANSSPTTCPAWRGVLPATQLQPYFPELPIFMENDANAAAIAEKWWGSGRGTDQPGLSLSWAPVSVSGWSIDGEIYRGFSGTAGEIGHTTIEANGRATAAAVTTAVWKATSVCPASCSTRAPAWPAIRAGGTSRTTECAECHPRGE